jgi:hypothetical protein
MERDVAITFVDGVPGHEKNKVVRRFLNELCREETAAIDDSSVPRLFGTDAETMVLAEAYERLPDDDRAMIERVCIYEDAA